MKSEKLTRFLGVILFVALLPGLTLAQAPGGPQRSIREPDIILKLELPSYEIVQDEEGFDIIQVEGFSLSGLPGDPWLPRKVYNVAVPPDAALDSLSLEIVDAQVVRLPGDYHLRLATPDLPAIEGDTAEYHSGYTPASDAASTDPVRLLAPGQKRKYRFARLEFTPFQYDDASGELSLVSELTIRINYDVSLAAKDEVLMRDRVMDDVAKQLLVNYETAQAWYQVANGHDEPSDVYDYVIITTNAIETGSSELADFITHKQGQGYSVLTITEDEYGSLVGQSPNGTAEKIRKWLQDNYVAYSIEYVLLIGNPDPDDPSSGSDSVGDVPMKMCWPRRTESSYRESPTDYFFADLTGNWDLDGDLYFGEWSGDTGTGGVDFANEVYVGRIPVYSGAYSTLDDILQKIIDYENEANPEVWRESALLPMSFSTTTYDGAPLAEQMMDDYLDAAGFSSWTQYQQGNGACSLDSTYASDEELRGGTVVRDRWAANDYGLVLWWGHGSQTSASVGCDGCWDGTLFNSTQTSSLDDDHPSHVYQNSCTNGYPENTNNLQYALLKQGAVSAVGATRVSWFNTGVGYGQFDGSTTNSGIGYEYAERLVQGQAAGDALYNAKVSMTPGSSTRLMNYYDFNLYGDPSTKIMTTPTSTHSISGYVRNSSSSGISGVTVDFGGAQPAVTTNGSGYYSQSGFNNGDYTVTFNRSGYAFSPVEDQVTVSGANVTHDATGYPFTPASLPFNDGFESGVLGSAWAAETDYEGRVRVDSTYPHAGSYSLLLDDDTDDEFISHASAILALDLSGQSQVDMSFWWREFWDEDDADDGVFISDDYGATWYQVFSFNGGSSTFTQATIDLDAQASAAGMDLNDHFLVKFQFYDDYPINSDGYAIDQVSVTSGGPAQWTFLVYLDGDNNLEGVGIDDFLEMASVGSDSGVNIVVQFDRISGYDTNYGDWTTTKRFLVTPGMTPTSGNALQDIGEANMGDPQTLVDFVQWGMANYPADHYAVILWNHGSGWRLTPDEIPIIKGVIYDDTDEDHIDMPELRSAMDTLSNGGSDPLDLVGFDACLMAMIEVDNQIIPYVDVRVGSEETEPGDGWPYDTILSSLSGDPAMSASQLGTVIVDDYYASYGNDETQSAVDLGSPYSDLNSAVNDLAVALINGMGSHYTDIATARGSTQEFFYPTYIDLYDFAYQVNQYVSDATINAAATAVMDAVNSAVIQEQHGAGWPGAHGISIYFPESEADYETHYDGSQGWLEFTADTQWDEWLHAFYSGGTCNDPHEPNETPGQATAIGYGTTLTDPDICPAGDVDYYAFAGSTGDTIIADIDAQAIGSSLDSYLYLYDTDGVTELTHNDDYDGLDSHIEYVLPTDGTYYLMVREYNHPSEGGPDYLYTISLQGFAPFDVDAGWTFSTPNVDGQIEAGEWDDAATYDITLPGARDQGQRDLAAEDMPEVLLLDGEQRQMPAVSRDILSTVTLYAMNDGTHLYLAMDNPNDTIENAYDQMGVYFDDNPLPSDGQWTNTSCGNPDGEGNFWVLTSTVEYREWITDAGPTTCDPVAPAPGTVGAVGYGSGHTQSEIAIDLTSSALRAASGDVINMYMWIYDAGTGIFDGRWPMGADYEDPSTYRPLTLATCPVPAAPSLLSPADSSSTCDTTPDFDWSSVSWATSYRIQVDDNPSFGSPEVDTTASDSNYTPGSALSPGTYYWHVQASNSCGDSSWSSMWSFTIMSTPATPTLSSPPNGDSISDNPPTFSWGGVSGATSYHIQVDDTSGFSSPEIDQTTSSTSLTPGSELPDSATYYWHVQASNSCDSGPWSEVWEFAIPAQSPWVAWIYLPAVVRGYP